MAKSLFIPAKDMQPFLRKSNLWGTWLLLFNWGVIAMALVLAAQFPHPVVWLLSCVLIANRQLRLAILMHECAHYSLFKHQGLNAWAGNFLCGAPVITDITGYRSYHMRHHVKAGTDADPDYPNYKPYPVTKASLRRKVIRDLTGITGLKTLFAMVLMAAGRMDYDLAYKSEKQHQLGLGTSLLNTVRNLSLPVLSNVLLWGLLFSAGHGELYALWWVSYLTFYMLFLRLRNAAEHGSVPDLLNTDPLLHARTTYANFWERLTVAPNYVNFHMEHHLRPDVPCYRLKAFHQYLLQKGHLADVNIASGYREVLQQLQRPA